MTAMAEGRIARVEELTRIPSDVQDALITILSEKSLPVPELGIEVQAVKGFSVIATANDRDRGVNDLSSALRRRFNTVVLPLPASEDEEVDIVTRRVAQLGQALELPEVPSAAEEIRRVVTVFRELRSGVTADQRTRLKSPTGTLSPAEAISVVTSGIVAGGALRRRGAARRRRRRGHHRRDRQGPGIRRRRLDGVPGGRRPRAARLGGLLPRLPRGRAVTLTGSRRENGARRDGDRSVLGVRHHGPGSARSVVAELDRIRPSVVLIEGPADADPLLGLAAAPGMAPPVALLGVRAGRAPGVRVLAVTPSSPPSGRRCCGRRATGCRRGSATCPPGRCWPPARRKKRDRRARRPSDDGSATAAEAQEAAASDEATGHRAGTRRRALVRNLLCPVPGADFAADPIGALAGAAGYDDPERWWEDLVEARADGSSPFAALTEAMAELRAALAPRRPLHERRREAHMRQVLRAALRETDGVVAVVCGAWHAPALAGPLPPASADAALLRGLPKRKAALAWVPWTHSRLAAASGYGAGITSPGWYHHLFATPDLTVERWLTRVAAVLRER